MSPLASERAERTTPEVPITPPFRPEQKAAGHDCWRAELRQSPCHKCRTWETSRKASVAQLDRASDFGSEGCRFKSCRTRHSIYPTKSGILGTFLRSKAARKIFTVWFLSGFGCCEASRCGLCPFSPVLAREHADTGTRHRKARHVGVAARPD